MSFQFERFFVSNSIEKSTGCTGWYRFGTYRTWVKSTGWYRCVYKTPDTGTTPELFAGRKGKVKPWAIGEGVHAFGFFSQAFQPIGVTYGR